MVKKSHQIAIIGFGVVGKSIKKIFKDAVIYDPRCDFSVSKDYVNSNCDLAIICVPTPPKNSTQEQAENIDDILEADISIIEESVTWINTPLILIKSTIPPGTTNELKKKFPYKKICFSPEYIGESKYYTPQEFLDPEDPTKHPFMIIGGENSHCEDILEFFREKLGPTKIYYKCSATEAEMIKYAENSFFATKVTFCNELYDICNLLNIDYNNVREGFVLDDRIGRMHTLVFKNHRGYGGKCLPKDVMALIKSAEGLDYSADLLKAVHRVNRKIKHEEKQ